MKLGWSVEWTTRNGQKVYICTDSRKEAEEKAMKAKKQKRVGVKICQCLY